jgi:uncharacterized protein
VLVRLGSPRAFARRAALGTVAASVAVVGLPTVAQAAVPTTPFISEIHYDNDGTDAGEFIEVQLPAGTTSAGLSVVLYNGGVGNNYGATYGTARALPTVNAPIDAPAVAVLDYPRDGLQNGDPDGIALVRGTTVLEFLSYEGVLTATNGAARGSVSTDIEVRESGTEPTGRSLSRSYDPARNALTWSGSATATKGVVNADRQLDSSDNCAKTPVPVGQVQGSGSETAGGQVTVRGTVVGDVPSLGGFYLQDAGDGDAATSDGIFVFSPVPVGLGDMVAVTGSASEFGSQTQVTSTQDVGTCELGDADDLPPAVSLDLPATDAEREPFEGMLVTPDSQLVVSEVFQLAGGATGGFGEMTLAADGVLLQPTEVARPGSPEAAAVAENNVLRRIVLDDASNARTNALNRPYLSPTSPVRVGDTLSFTAPTVLGYGFSNWRLQPADGTPDGTLAGQNTRTAAPDEVGGDVQLGAFNVLNYFVTLSGPDARGATSSAEFEEQANKIVPAIEALGADVVTLMEIEDTDSTGYSVGDADKALENLVGRLNAAAGYDKWEYVPLPDELYAVDRDVIRSAIIYQPGVVQPVGDSVGLVDETVWLNAREPIAQSFVKDGDVFTVVANHFKSKGNSNPAQSGDTNDNVDRGQGAFNGDRVRQAKSLAAFTDALRQSTGDADVVLMGDFNAYTMEDPTEALRQAGYTDLGTTLDPTRYSYVFDALSGSLDHALATAELTRKVTGFAHWNINGVESSAYEYGGDPAFYAPNPYRSSDHDPLVLGIDLNNNCQGLEPTIVGTEAADVLTGTDGRDVIAGLGGDDVIRGGTAEDVICGGLGDDVISGGNGDDVVLGGFGDDDLNGDNGADALIGGPGEDGLAQGRGIGREEEAGASS